jgi:type IV pilus assembly protein PilW
MKGRQVIVVPARIDEPRRGFSMIELLVTLVLGMIAIIVMMQILSSYEGRKRTTTGGDSAQSNGALAIHGLQRDLQQAGMGLNADSIIGCDVTLGTGVTVSGMGPVVINHPNIPAGDANTDTLLVSYGSSDDAPEGTLIVAQDALANTYSLVGVSSASSPSYSAGDKVIAHPADRPATCAATLETVTGLSGNEVTVNSSTAGRMGGTLFNLGPSPTVLAYAVRSAQLTVCNYSANNCGGTYNAAHWVPIASNLVSLRAQYGSDGSGADGVVDTWDQATPASTSSCEWVRTRAVRLALVTRNAQLETSNVASAPSWSASAAVPIDLSNDSNWQRYRYKTFETTVPLRNMTWLKSC